MTPKVEGDCRVADVLTLRDHFACVALQGLLAGDTECTIPPSLAATMAYQQADAMLAARDQRTT